MKKFKFLSILALVSMLILAACSGGNDGDGGKSSSGKSDDGKVNLKFVHWINEDVGKWEPIIEKYEAENPGVTIESMPLVDNMTHADYVKQLDLMASANEQIDVMMFSNGNDHAKRVEAGLVAPLDEFFEEEGIEIDDVYNNSYAAINDQYYGLPMKGVTNLVMINKSHLDEAGLEIPTEWTWDDYREYAKKMTTDDHYGTYLHTWHEIFSSLKLMSKADETALLKPDGSSNADDPLLKESLEYRYELEQEDKSAVPFFETFSQKLDYRQQFFSQSASMIPTGSFMITEWGQFTPDFEIVWAPWPQNKAGDNYAVFGGDVIALSNTSKNKEEAYKFIRWLSTEGISEQGVWMPSWKEADLDAVLEELVKATSNPDASDLESLKHALSAVQPSANSAPAPYITEVITEFGAEVEMYLLGEQDIDKTIENIQKKTQAVVDANK